MANRQEQLTKGILRLIWALPLMLTGPVIINSSFKNTDKVLFYPVLAFGIAFCIFGVYLAFKGIKIIVDTLLDDDDQ